jgi:hypothetical protein
MVFAPWSIALNLPCLFMASTAYMTSSTRPIFSSLVVSPSLRHGCAGAKERTPLILIFGHSLRVPLPTVFNAAVQQMGRQKTEKCSRRGVEVKIGFLHR